MRIKEFEQTIATGEFAPTWQKVILGLDYPHLAPESGLGRLAIELTEDRFQAVHQCANLNRRGQAFEGETREAFNTEYLTGRRNSLFYCTYIDLERRLASRPYRSTVKQVRDCRLMEIRKNAGDSRGTKRDLRKLMKRISNLYLTEADLHFQDLHTA